MAAVPHPPAAGSVGTRVEGQSFTLELPVWTEESTLSSVATARIRRPALSSVYRRRASDNCLRLLRQEIFCPFIFALANAGNNMAARMAMMAITTSSSIRVKAAGFRLPGGLGNGRMGGMKGLCIYQL